MLWELSRTSVEIRNGTDVSYGQRNHFQKELSTWVMQERIMKSSYGYSEPVLTIGRHFRGKFNPCNLRFLIKEC